MELIVEDSQQQWEFMRIDGTLKVVIQQTNQKQDDFLLKWLAFGDSNI